MFTDYDKNDVLCELHLTHTPRVCAQIPPGHPGVVSPPPPPRQPVPHPLHLPQHADQVPEISDRDTSWVLQ